MYTSTCKRLFVRTCVYLCGVHVATSPGNNTILSSYTFIRDLSVSTRHACQLQMINQLAMCGVDIATVCL